MSAREQALEALRSVLQGLPGVRLVDRQTITEDVVADAQMPAILIDETRTEYSWDERHGRRALGARIGITLDLQVRAGRRNDGPGAAVSTAREAFVFAVIEHLSNNPSLRCQLTGEATATDHVIDCAGGFVVDYPPTTHPYGRALVTFEMTLTECPVDARGRTAWQTLAIELVYPYPGAADEERKTFTLEIPST